MKKLEKLKIDLPIYDKDNAQVGDIVRLVNDKPYYDQLIKIEQIVNKGFKGVILLSNVSSQPPGFRGTYWSWEGPRGEKLYLYERK